MTNNSNKRNVKRNGLLRSHLVNDHPDYLPLAVFNGNEYIT